MLGQRSISARLDCQTTPARDRSLTFVATIVATIVARGFTEPGLPSFLLALRQQAHDKKLFLYFPIGAVVSGAALCRASKRSAEDTAAQHRVYC